MADEGIVGAVDVLDEPVAEETETLEETSAEEPAEEPAEDPSGEEAEGEDEEKETKPEETAERDGRRMPDNIRKAIAAAKDIPGAAGALRDLYFSNNDYRAVFPKPEDAVAARSLIDEVGGPEGIKEIQSEREEWEAIDKGFAEGSPEFVKQIAESNPESFGKVAVNVINEFAARHQDQYKAYADTVAANTVLSIPGLQDGLIELSRLHEQLAEHPQYQQAIKNVVNGIVGLRDSSQQLQQKKVDPREQQLKERETAFEERRRADFEDGVATEARNHLNASLKSEIDKVLNGRKVDDDAYGNIQAMVEREIEKRLGEVPGFESQLEAQYRTGNRERSVTYIKSQYDRITPEAVKKIVGPLYRNVSAPVQRVTPRVSAKPGERTVAPGSVVLREMPGRDEIDWSKTTMPDVMSGKAVLTNGKRATGWM